MGPRWYHEPRVNSPGFVRARDRPKIVVIDSAEQGTIRFPRCHHGRPGFSVTTPRIATDGAELDLAATLLHSDRLSFRAEYDADLRAGYQSHTGLIKPLWQV